MNHAIVSVVGSRHKRPNYAQCAIQVITNQTSTMVRVDAHSAAVLSMDFDQPRRLQPPQYLIVIASRSHSLITKPLNVKLARLQESNASVVSSMKQAWTTVLTVVLGNICCQLPLKVFG